VNMNKMRLLLCTTGAQIVDVATCTLKFLPFQPQDCKLQLMELGANCSGCHSSRCSANVLLAGNTKRLFACLM
jgi:hypothetical protein